MAGGGDFKYGGAAHTAGVDCCSTDDIRVVQKSLSLSRHPLIAKLPPKALSYPTPPISERALFFGRLPGFVRLSWYEQHVDGDECGVSVEWRNGADRGNGSTGREPRYNATS